jgi:hypothetical protein
MFILKCEHVCLFQMKNNQNFKSYWNMFFILLFIYKIL